MITVTKDYSQWFFIVQEAIVEMKKGEDVQFNFNSLSNEEYEGFKELLKLNLETYGCGICIDMRKYDKHVSRLNMMRGSAKFQVEKYQAELLNVLEKDHSHYQMKTYDMRSYVNATPDQIEGIEMIKFIRGLMNYIKDYNKKSN